MYKVLFKHAIIRDIAKSCNMLKYCVNWQCEDEIANSTAAIFTISANKKKAFLLLPDNYFLGRDKGLQIIFEACELQFVYCILYCRVLLFSIRVWKLFVKKLVLYRIHLLQQFFSPLFVLIKSILEKIFFIKIILH